MYIEKKDHFHIIIKNIFEKYDYLLLFILRFLII